MSSELILVARCRAHQQRPDKDCLSCERAVEVNRASLGWGSYVEVSPEGLIVEWEMYQPITAWAGPAAKGKK